MLPLIAAIAIAVAVAAAIAGVAWFAFQENKAYALIGMKAAGKTTWRTFLTEGQIPKGYVHTITTVKGKVSEEVEKDLNLGDLNLNVTIIDMSGSEDAMVEWRQHCENANFVFFFLDITQLGQEKYRGQCMRRARQVSKWELTHPVYVAATHADLDPEWRGGDGYDTLRTRSDVQELKQILGARGVFVGNLGSEPGLRDFTIRVMKSLKEVDI